MTPNIKHFYHEETGTLSYVVSDGNTGRAAIIDPVLGYCVVSGRTDSVHADRIAAYVRANGMAVQWILETHAHADHLTAAQYLKDLLGGTVAIGIGITSVQQNFGQLFNLKAPFHADGRQFDRLFSDGDVFSIGEVEVRVLATPGHTNDSVTYVAGNAAFVGDTVFMTDFGTARCDFPGGDPGLLYDSIQKLFALPDATEFYLCHDYPPETRDLRVSTSLAEQKADNVHVGGGVTRDAFVAMRSERDRKLSLPRLILPAIQVNIRAGHLPEPEDNDIAYVKLPLDAL